MNAAAWDVDRSTRFLARVDLHLANLDDQQRLRFLQAQLGAWERAYARFVCLNDGDMDPPFAENDPPTASDYLLTIVGLAARLTELTQSKQAA